MAEYITGVAAPILFFLGIGLWFLILVGSVALVALVYGLRDAWKRR